MRILIIAVLLLSSITAFGQSSDLGIKGGLNYGTGVDFITNATVNQEDQVGYHLGVFGKFEFSGLFIQPEIVFTKLRTSFDSDNINIGSTDYNLSKIDVPLLGGLEIVGPLNIKLGPSFQYIINNDFDVEDPENSFTIGYQVGAGVTLGRLGLDIRYEGGFSEDSGITADVEVEIDTRPSQWILSVSYVFDRR